MNDVMIETNSEKSKEFDMRKFGFLQGYITVGLYAIAFATIIFLTIFFYQIANNHKLTIDFMPIDFIRIELSPEVAKTISPTDLEAHSTILKIHEVTDQIKFESRDSSYYILFFITTMGLLGIAFYSGYLLRQFFLTVRKEGPFVRKNADILRQFGFLGIYSSIGYVIMSIIWLVYLASVMQLAPGCKLHYHLPGNSWDCFLMGIFFIALAEVFKLGARLKEENDLTV